MSYLDVSGQPLGYCQCAWLLVVLLFVLEFSESLQQSCEFVSRKLQQALHEGPRDVPKHKEHALHVCG